MKKKCLFCLLIHIVLIASCDKKDKNNGGEPPQNWFVGFELVDSTGQYLFDSISELPFDTMKSYFTDAEGTQHPFNINNGGVVVVSPMDSTGVSFVASKDHTSFKNLEVQMSQFTWLLYIDLAYPPDTFTVYGPKEPGGTADSALLNQTKIYPYDTIAGHLPIIHLKYPNQ